MSDFVNYHPEIEESRLRLAVSLIYVAQVAFLEISLIPIVARFERWSRIPLYIILSIVDITSLILFVIHTRESLLEWFFITFHVAVFGTGTVHALLTALIGYWKSFQIAKDMTFSDVLSGSLLKMGYASVISFLLAISLAVIAFFLREIYVAFVALGLSIISYLTMILYVDSLRKQAGPRTLQRMFYGYIFGIFIEIPKYFIFIWPFIKLSRSGVNLMDLEELIDSPEVRAAIRRDLAIGSSIALALFDALSRVNNLTKMGFSPLDSCFGKREYFSVMDKDLYLTLTNM